jgi:mono/diheme cytochrome c family protein
LTIVIFGFLSTAVYAQEAIGKEAMEMGKTIYTERCMTCHQIDGSGAQNMIPPIISNDYVLGDKGRIIKIVLNGMSGEIQVNGATYAGEMPSHKDLSDEQVAAVLTYVRNNFGNRASAVSKDEVKKVRENE